jgi:hypothetical protein
MFVQLARISLGRLDTEIIPHIWDYVTRQFTFGRITVSVSSVFLGVFVVLLTIFISRWSSVLIERRLTNRRHIDPRAALYDLPAREVCHHHRRRAGSIEAGV